MRLINIFFVFFFVTSLCASNTKLLLLSGPSGIGKSTVIRELQKMDHRFVYIKPYTTRPLRDGETDKIHASLEKIKALQEQNQLIALNYLYGNYYATPLFPILNALKQVQFPVLDWPVTKIKHMKAPYW